MKILLLLFLLLFTVARTSFASMGGAPAGDITLELSTLPKAGQIFQVKVTFTPYEDGRDVNLLLLIYNGLELEEADAVPLPNRDTGMRKVMLERKPGKVEKNKPITLTARVRVLQPGVWLISAAMNYFRGQKNFSIPHGFFSSNRGIWLVINEQGTTTYEKFEDIPKDALVTPCIMDIEYFEGKGKKEGKHFTAYLPKETRLDFEPMYQFKVFYGASDNAFKADTSKLSGSPVWSVKGNIGTVDNTGLFTAIKFGKGKVCVKHSILEDCVDVEVVVLPNPSPGDKIVDVVVVPYETEEEKKHADDVLKENKSKPFKTLKEAREKLNPKGYKKAKLEKNKGEFVDVDEIVMVNLTKKKLLKKAITADGRILNMAFPDIGINEQKGDIPFGDIAFLAADGTVKAVSPGEIQQYTQREFSIFRILPLDHIVIQPAYAEIKLGDTFSYKAYGYDKEGNYGELAYPVWKVIGDIGVVDINGKFKAEKIGEGTIKVYSMGAPEESFFAEIKVIVMP